MDPSRSPTRGPVWHPDMSWTATLRERSLELLGEEKALDSGFWGCPPGGREQRHLRFAAPRAERGWRRAGYLAG
ncbi:MAG: hypothetical protein ACRDQ4_11515 [Pseudonocardiaceae bacterium]